MRVEHGCVSTQSGCMPIALPLFHPPAYHESLKVGKGKKSIFAVPLFYTCLDNLASHGSHFSYCHPKMGLSSFWCWESQKCHLGFLSDHPLPMLCWSDICWLNAFKTQNAVAATIVTLK